MRGEWLVGLRISAAIPQDLFGVSATPSGISEGLRSPSEHEPRAKRSSPTPVQSLSPSSLSGVRQTDSGAASLPPLQISPPPPSSSPLSVPRRPPGWYSLGKCGPAWASAGSIRLLSSPMGCSLARGRMCLRRLPFLFKSQQKANPVFSLRLFRWIRTHWKCRAERPWLVTWHDEGFPGSQL